MITEWISQLTDHYEEVKCNRQRVIEQIKRYHPMQSAQAIIDLLEQKEGAVH
ncbi:hypothetical protein D3C85_1600200 [compost metagenome]